MYEKQTYSHKNRQLFRQLEIFYADENGLNNPDKKYFKTFYKGKPTKRYKRIMEKLKQAASFSPEQLERLYLK